MLAFTDRQDLDLVTNVQVRTFPRGHSAELIHAPEFARIDPSRLRPEEQEHLTKVYYNHPASYRILNLESGDPHLGGQSFVVDSVEDLRRLEKVEVSDLETTSGPTALAQISA
jgi:spore coat polysaccharide biosynthesis protein SpsF